MFGYIAINKAEMKFKDYDVYQAYYCGLCRRLKECYGKRGQLTLSYDMTFLIVLLTGLYEPKTIACLLYTSFPPSPVLMETWILPASIFFPNSTAAS